MRFSSVLTIFLLLIVSSACVAHRTQSPSLTRYQFEHPEMGMPFRIVLYAPDEATVSRAAAAAFDRIQGLNDVMSDYDADSELNGLKGRLGRC